MMWCLQDYVISTAYKVVLQTKKIKQTIKKKNQLHTYDLFYAKKNINIYIYNSKKSKIYISAKFPAPHLRGQIYV